MHGLKLLCSAKWVIIAALMMTISCGSCEDVRRVTTDTLQQNEYRVRRAILSNTVRIICDGGSGSGTLAYQNLVITAYHVVSSNDDGHQIDIFDSENNLSQGWVVAYGDPVNDIAVLQRPDTTVNGSRRWYGWGHDISEGSKVYVGGHPWGMTAGILTDGYICSVASDSSYFWISANALPGSSGSGVYTADGMYIGTLVRGMVRFGTWSQFTFHAIPITRMTTRFDRLNLDN